MVFLVLVVIFIAQNTQDAKVAFLGWHGSLPLGVWLLITAVLGALVVLMAGTARVLQLRMSVRRHEKVVKTQRQHMDQTSQQSDQTT